MSGAHEFVTVGARRWCLGCDLFQCRRSAAWPSVGACPCTTPYAQARIPDPVPEVLDWPIANKVADLREEPCDRVGLNKFLGAAEGDAS
jgi:hypothetical protein